MKIEEYEALESRLGKTYFRLQTSVGIRWLGVLGQTLAVLVVAILLQFEFPVVSCLALIFASVLLNLILRIVFKLNERLSNQMLFVLLAYDLVQLTALLFLTGGLQNPFSILLLVPVVISATATLARPTFILGLLGVACVTFLALYHLPLPSPQGAELTLPALYVTGMWFALTSTLTFMTVYVFRVSHEARRRSDALIATEIVMQREQHLSNLDGLAAATAHELGTPLGTVTLVAKEMKNATDPDSPLYEDIELLHSEAQRCRAILRKLSSLSTQDEILFSRIAFSEILNEVIEPFQGQELAIELKITNGPKPPTCMRNPALLYGLGNLVENAVDFAENEVHLSLVWDEAFVRLIINDDGQEM